MQSKTDTVFVMEGVADNFASMKSEDLSGSRNSCKPHRVTLYASFSDSRKKLLLSNKKTGGRALSSRRF